ncbi:MULTISPECIES: HsdR family type I site-specific deoxyribonuclease [unclassified Variovorax]|uniref:type I restriction endonuclease subunit R n=1 Tax=unclassified Variovorax TaxID=663243 RepID=UPI00076C6400|nr:MULTISPECIES: HsdR family type I site-specific deoxyribonuclease [unclassified Variovorax]KWT97621.1 Type I restriction-modification system, restriction subunit R [Variovorax sp. WDL1]
MVSPSTREQYRARMLALHMLCNLGWNYLSAADCATLRGSTREVLLKPRLIEVLQTRRFDYKGNPHHLSPSAIDQILRELSTVGLGEGLLIANERLYAKLAYGMTVTEFMPDGRRHQPTIHVIDWLDASANRFDVTEELRVLSSHGTHHRAPDIVGYVNGIPLVVIEAKQPHGRHSGSMADAMVLEGISQQLRNQRHDEIPDLFAYAQLLLSIGQTEGRYGTTATPAKLWALWNKEEEFDDAHVGTLKNAPLPASAHAALFEDKPALMRDWFDSLGSLPMQPNEQDRLLVSLLTPQRLLDLLRGFVLFDSRIGKIVARHQQFFAVRALRDRLSGLRADGGRNGGVIWHTAGSGKSFTMVFLAKALLLNEDLKECRLVVITDRRDLEQQLARNFMSGGAFGSSIATHKEGEHSKALTGRDLARRIGHGAKRITFALVQKFNTASRLAECRNDSPNVVVLVDEGHRSHGGETHERMKRALPHAAYVAFTGTPLLKAEKTEEKFGPIIHAYTMQRAVEDHAVAPLLYEERVPELSIDAQAVDRWFDRITAGLAEAQRADLKKKYASSGAVHGAANRIELIAWDIATHFHQNFKRIGSGLKGQVATASKLDAIRYKKALDQTGLVTSAIVISPPDMREGSTAIDEDGMPKLQEWWKQNVLDHGDAIHYERQVLQAFATDGDPDLLIVVDRLLTGFDEPRNAVLYIDKPLKGHNLIQAVSRVNRLHDAKRHGLLVDYRGILKALDTAIRAYQDLEARTQGGFDIGDLEGLYAQVSTEYKLLPMRHEAVWSFFKDVANRKDPEQLRQALSPRFVSDGQGGEYDERQKLRDDFHAALTAFGTCLQTALASRGFFSDRSVSQALIAQYKADLKALIQVRQMAQRDARETVDFSEYDEQIRRLVDDQVICTRVREIDGAYVVHKLGVPDVSETWSQDKARNEADLIKTRLRKTIEQDLADDPYAQKVFSELLKGAIEQAEAMFDHPRRQYALLREFERDVDRRATPGMPEILASNPQARACYGAILIALGDEASRLNEAQRSKHIDHAIAISQVMHAAMAEHSLNPQNIEAAVRKGLLQRLYAPLGLARANEVIGHVLRIIRVDMGRRA